MTNIDPNRLYTARQMTSLIGRRALSSLRKAGLRALGDRYLGIQILDAWRSWAAGKLRQNDLGGHEEIDYGTSKMAPCMAGKGHQLVSKSAATKSLRDQLEEAERLRQASI